MKVAIAILSFFIVTAFVALLTKPSDRYCLTETTAHKMGHNLVNDFVNDFGISSLAYRVEDHLWIKVVVNQSDDRWISIGAFGKVFLL